MQVEAKLESRCAALDAQLEAAQAEISLQVPPAPEPEPESEPFAS